MADQYIGMSVAVIVVTASIALAGILIGVGRAFGYRRLESFGIEELVQSVINAALIGGLASVIALMSGISASLVTVQCGTGDAPLQLSCSLETLKSSLFGMFQETMRATELLGYYQSLALHFTAFSIQPFSNLSSVSNILSAQLLTMQALLMLLELNVQMLNFVGQNALLLLLPIGLVLRTIFATRKAGGFMIALAIGLYLFYPALVLVFPNPSDAVANATLAVGGFNNNSLYATEPVIDLNGNYAIAGKLDLMAGRCSGNLSNSSACNNLTFSGPGSGSLNSTGNSTYAADFTGDLTAVVQSNSDSLAKVAFYSVVAPLLSFLVTIVFVKEVGELLGAEIGLSVISSI